MHASDQYYMHKGGITGWYEDKHGLKFEWQEDLTYICNS